MKDKKVKRLIKSAVDTSTNVLRALCQKKLLSDSGEDFQSFLTKNLHYFFHQYEGENIRCCECTLSNCENTKTTDFTKSVLLQAYVYKGDPADGHVVTEEENIVQKCMHTYETRKISLDELDTEALSVFLLHKGHLSPEENEAIKVIRSTVQRLDDTKQEQPHNMEVKWADLEKAVILLTHPHYYRQLVKEVFDEICKLDQSKPEATGIKKEKPLNPKKECSISEEEWISDNEGPSMKNKSDEQNMQMLTKLFKSVVPTERNNKSSSENVADVDKILIQPCAIEKKIGKLTLNVQYQRIIKTDKVDPTFELGPMDVKWNIKTPKGWKIEKIIKKLKSKMDEISTNLPLRIKNITRGSVNILTTVEADVLTDQTKSNRVFKSFLGKIVNAGGFGTNRRQTINVRAEIVHEDPTFTFEMSATSLEMPVDIVKATTGVFEFCANERVNYPGTFMCDGFIVDCIVDRRLARKSSGHWPFDIDMLQEFMITYPFKKLLNNHRSFQEQSFTNKSWHERFIRSIRLSALGMPVTNSGLECRYLLSHSNHNNDDSIDILHSVLTSAIKAQSYNCAKALAWKITRLFVKSFKKKSFYDVWPGFICNCKDKCEPLEDYEICSSDIVIVVEVYAVEDVFPRPNVFHGIPITYKVVKGNSPEANLISKEIDQYQNVEDNSCAVNVSNEQAQQFFSAHSKLCLITKSSLRSKGYSRKKQKQTFVKEPCIQLFCRFKGIIPVGEKHFPTSIDSFATDVLEGYPQLLVKDVKIGSEVGSSCRAGTGTLGGFVKFHGEDALLTCAHVVLERDLLGSNANRPEMHENPIVVYCKNPDELEFKCGKLVSYVFPPELSEGTSVDAAIIRMDPFSRISENVVAVDREGHCLKSMYLHRNYIDYREIGTIHEVQVAAVGAISSVQQRHDRICLEDKKQVEFETLAHAVRNKVNHYPTPLDINDCIHLVDHAIKQVGDEELKTPRTVTLHQQISMRKVSFTQGDSGMCIYVKCPDNQFRCLGMAIASHPDGGCIITPIKAILSAFKLI